MIKDLSYLHDSRALCPLPRARPAQNKHNLRLHHHTQPVRNAWELLRQPVQQSHYHKPRGWERAALMNDHRPLRVRYRAAWMTAWCVSRKCAGQIPLPPYTCPTNQRAEETLTFLKPRPQFWMLSRTRTPPESGVRAPASAPGLPCPLIISDLFLDPYKLNVSVPKFWPNVQIILPYFRFADAWPSLYHKVWLIIQCLCIFFTEKKIPLQNIVFFF